MLTAGMAEIIVCHWRGPRIYRMMGALMLIDGIAALLTDYWWMAFILVAMAGPFLAPFDNPYAEYMRPIHMATKSAMEDTVK